MRKFSMSKYRNNLPQLAGDLFMCDGGLETTLIFQDGINLPEFAAFLAMNDEAGRRALLRYYRAYLEIAQRRGLGMILDSPTWRSNSDWGKKLGFSNQGLADINTTAIQFVEDLRTLFETEKTRIVVDGVIGPRGDGYVPSARMSAHEAEVYHSDQIRVFANTSADMVTALTLNYVEEAIGIVAAAKSVGMPVAISFTVETNGHLPTGQTLRDAIETTDAATGAAPIYYMINCAHPSHFNKALQPGDDWLNRIRGLRANASKMSHAELNESPILDAGDPLELSQQYGALRSTLKHLNLVGGCCGTDHRHIDEICQAFQDGQ